MFKMFYKLWKQMQENWYINNELRDTNEVKVQASKSNLLSEPLKSFLSVVRGNPQRFNKCLILKTGRYSTYTIQDKFTREIWRGDYANGEFTIISSVSGTQYEWITPSEFETLALEIVAIMAEYYKAKRKRVTNRCSRNVKARLTRIYCEGKYEEE